MLFDVQENFLWYIKPKSPSCTCDIEPLGELISCSPRLQIGMESGMKTIVLVRNRTTIELTHDGIQSPIFNLDSRVP
jgi:hypothetical protein